MKYLAGLLCLLAPLALVAYLMQSGGSSEHLPSPDDVGAPSLGDPSAHGDASRVAALERRIDELTAELRGLAADVAMMSRERRASLDARPAAAADAPAESVEGRSPHWYLEQYVASFHGGGEGSEYFRLAVEAYAPSLVPEISAWVLDAAAPAQLRTKLVAMFGARRFKNDGRVLDTLVSFLRMQPEPEAAAAALNALQVVGNERTAVALEHWVWRYERPDVQWLAIQLIVSLSGDGANRALVRLLQSAPNDVARAYVLRLLTPGEEAGALQAFQLARSMDVVVRLQAAELIGNFRGPAFQAFVDQWIAIETDEQVKRVLGQSRAKQDEVPRWHPMRATGAPNAADLRRDSPDAWATKLQDKGHEWIELTYATPIRATSVRIFQVLAGGAIAEVHAIDTGGSRHLLWKGRQDSTSPGPFEVTFDKTPYPVRGLRIVLDTSRATGWNEIDAVELVGPGARAWAQSARASSYYGS